jgi:hypothetical protein
VKSDLNDKDHTILTKEVVATLNRRGKEYFPYTVQSELDKYIFGGVQWEAS